MQFFLILDLIAVFVAISKVIEVFFWGGGVITALICSCFSFSWKDRKMPRLHLSQMMCQHVLPMSKTTTGVVVFDTWEVISKSLLIRKHTE